jgi:hypothetical protein
MDIQTIDQQYQQLQTQDQQVAQALQTLAGKLQTAAQGGDNGAREWLLDLREMALSIQAEQQQTTALLQAIHGMWQNQAQQVAANPMMAGFGGTSGGGVHPQQGGLMGALGGFLNSGFGRAIEMGAGFGIGDDLIGSIL